MSYLRDVGGAREGANFVSDADDDTFDLFYLEWDCDLDGSDGIGEGYHVPRLGYERAYQDEMYNRSSWTD